MRSLWPLALLLGGCTQGPDPVPGRIASNNPCIDAILARTARPDQIGAVSLWSQEEESASAPVGWARQFPAIGAGAEELIRARPRLALTGNYAGEGLTTALGRAGIAHIAMGVPATIAENKDQIGRVARAIGRGDQGDLLLREIDQATAQRPANGKSAIIWQSSGFVAGRGTIQDELLARAGFANASSLYQLGQWQMLPLETVMRRPPDVIFTPVSAGAEDARGLALRLSALKRLGRAVKIVPFPETLLLCGGPKLIEASRIIRSAA